MFHRASSIRFRLTLINLTIVSLTLLVVSVIILRLREQELLDDFDEQLQNQAEVMLESIQLAANFEKERFFSREKRPRLIPFRFPGYSFQLRLADGTLLEKSRDLSSAELPFTAQQSSSKQAHLKTVEVQFVEGEPPKRLRLLTVFKQQRGLPSYYFQVGRTLIVAEEAIAALRRIVFTLVPLAIILSGIASYLFSGRALTPIRQIVKETRELSAESLIKRLPLPKHDDEVTELVATLNDMLSRVSSAFEAQDRFVANASHELRTPISVIMGMTSVLKRQSRTAEDYDNFISSLEDEIRGLANTINSLLILSRANAGLLPSATQIVSVNDVVVEAVQRCQPIAEQREVRVVTQLIFPKEDQPEASVRGDMQLLTTMVSNLLRNAIRYSPVDQPMEVRVSVEGEQVQIQVRDHGPGIAPQHVDRVFDRFYNVSAEEPGYQGVGLGLAIVKGVAELHLGSARLRNHPDGGCEFTVHLPLAKPQDR